MQRPIIRYKNAVSEVLKKFNELENAMRIHLGKADPALIVDLILRQRKEKDPIYTLEAFINDIEFVDRIKGTYAGVQGSIGPVYEKDD